MGQHKEGHVKKNTKEGLTRVAMSEVGKRRKWIQNCEGDREHEGQKGIMEGGYKKGKELEDWTPSEPTKPPQRGVWRRKDGGDLTGGRNQTIKKENCDSKKETL